MAFQLSYVMIAGAVVAALGLIWLIVAVLRFRRIGPPAATVVAGGALIAAAYGLQIYCGDLAAHERMVGDPVHGQARKITITGWQRDDYAVLQKRPDTIILHMANGDVTDATLVHLKDMRLLRELDLNDTQITDAGLALLAALPALETVRLRHTKITDAGFRQFLLNKDWLTEIDLTGTAVSAETITAWKQQRDGRTVIE